MNISPIRTDADHRAALATIENLWDAEPGTKSFDKLELLSLLVERYENERWPTKAVHDPVAVLTYLVTDGGHSQAELAQIIGSASRASEILNRKRPLTVEMIRKISAAWKISADLLIGEIELA